MVVSAQSFVVVDKNGNKTTYDVTKVESVTFQSDTPGITVNESADKANPDGKSTKYTFDNLQSLAGDPDYLFASKDSVEVDGEGEDFTFSVRHSTTYSYNVSDSWITFGSKDSDTETYTFSAGLNPNTKKRKGWIALVSNDNARTDTIYVIQAAKYDSRYIDIDWAKTTLDNFNEETGSATLTFTGDVPVMGDYDVVLLPSENSYVIRVIDDIQQTEGTKTVTLATRQGVMGNLFKGTKFKLATESSAGTRGASDDDGIPVYLPTKVELINGNECVELYDANNASTRAPQGFEHEFISWEYNDDGKVLWESGVQSLSWDKLNFSVGLKGLFSFDFGDKEWEKVRMGDLQNLKITLEGGFDMEMIMKYTVASEVKYEKEWTLKENAIPNLKYTFTVGTVPVYITVGADLMAKVELGASGEASVTSGVTASTKVAYGVEWDYEKGLSKISECEKSLELVGPDLDINAHAEASASAYPKIEIGIYKVLCPTISPMPYLKAEADGRLVDNSKVAWNAGISTGVDLGLGLCLDLFFWKKDLGEIDPINVFDLPLVSLPDEIELQNEKEEQMLVNNQKEVKYHVTNKNYLTGTSYNAPGVLVKFEAEGGEISSEYDYTDKNGDVSVMYTPKSGEKGGVVKAEVVLGAEPEKEEDAMKADDYAIEAIDYRLTGGSYTIPEGETSVDVTFQLDKYSSKTATWAGEQGRTVSFTATNGTVSPSSGVTDSNGKVTVTFTAGDNFSEGSVTASVSGSDPSSWSKTTAATITAGAGGGGDDDTFNKAKKLDDNVYIIRDKDGKEQTRSFVQEEWSSWYTGKSPQDGSQVVKISIEELNSQGSTSGGGYMELPVSLVGSNTAITPSFLKENPAFHMMAFSTINPEGEHTSNNELNAKAGYGDAGNLKTDGSSQFLVSQQSSSSARTRALDENYTGTLTYVFSYTFTSHIYNEETGQEELGDEYTIYGKAVVDQIFPKIGYYKLVPESGFVEVGKSVTVNVEDVTDGATWDWNDVELLASYVDYSNYETDEGYFSWDPTTHSITSLKTNNNESVYVRFGLKSNPDLTSYFTMRTGDGWPYTSFTITPAEQEVVKGYNCQMSVDSWAPESVETWDPYSIEIDPASDPNGYFKYEPGFPRLRAFYSCKPGTYNIRMRLMSNHNVGFTMKITVTDE
jgi:hypothetical protein